MKLKESYIHLQGLRFHACHGVEAQEHVVGNDYQVDLRIGYPVLMAALHDDVKLTLNYASVYQLVDEEMKVEAKLVERVAYRIGERLMAEYPKISEVDIRLTKLNPPMGADCKGAGVELHLINDKTAG